MLKKLAYVLLGLLALVAVALAVGRCYVGRAEADPGRNAVLPGLSGPVEVWRDSLGVPHVWAANEMDLFRAMGYVHAQDRLWQMELFRRVADGRMAEVLGGGLVDTDKFLRTVGMGRAAAENERALDPGQRALLQAYADGVNAWITSRPGPLPPEFLALRTEPEPWTVRNSLSIAKIMAWDLAEWNLGLDLQRATEAVGPELAADLYPRYPDDGLTILGADAQWEGRGTAGPPPAQARRTDEPAAPPTAGTPIPRLPALAAHLLDGVSIARASNSWVIGGGRTKSGKPILANDMHLALRAPSIWYLAAIHGGGIEATGMTLPGVPVIVAGHSRHVAWAYTNAMVDDVDFFVEEVDSANPRRYRTGDGWADFAARPETIRVKGGEPVVHVVRSTRHGPVLTDVEERGGGRVMAMRWTAQDPSTEVVALLGMNRATSAEEFMQAIRGFSNPHQNVVFADADGTIGYWMAGRVPLRASGDGVLPARGWTGEGEWNGWLSFDQHPHVVNPADGFIVTANNRQVGPEYPHLITTDWAEPYRAMRIREMVEAGTGFTAGDVARQQMDVRDAFARRHLPHAVRAAQLAGDSAALRELRGWNGEARADSRAAALFYTWFEALRTRVGNDEYRDHEVYFPRAALERVLARGGGAWVDDVSTPAVETLDGLSADAMREAVRVAGGRTWGELHPTRIDHPLGVVKVFDSALGLNIGPFPNGGSPHTVAVAGYGARQPPFRNGYGPSQRHVVDMADVDGSGGFVIPTGQSGLPTSRHYQDQTPMWRTGRLWLIPLDRGKAQARRVSRMVLTPVEGRM
ncbi:MAG TPA: penicillin acylase family protein [Longimicrobiaceae bacterium]|nr:penicillin acylase family protein [Longimicrobiaceae bacterium]